MAPIEKNSHVPAYVQIANQLEADIRDGALVPGTHLTAERTLSQTLGVARGTIKEAYRELQRRGLVETMGGSGTYVRLPDAARPLPGDSLDPLRALVGELISRRLSPQEIDRLLRDGAWGALPQDEKLSLAWVDCSPEMFTPTIRQLEGLGSLRVTPFELFSVLEHPEQLLHQRFDLVVTTINHYENLRDVLHAVPALATLPLSMVVLSLSQRTISGLASIPPGESVAVLYGSELYRYCVECFLRELSFRSTPVYLSIELGPEELSRRLSLYRTAILPSDTGYENGFVGRMTDFCSQHSIVVHPFEELLDRGSLLNLSETAQKLWLGRAAGS